MRSQSQRNPTTAFDEVRNPFDVMDVPDPDDQEVQAFAAGATLAGTADDENAQAWGTAGRGRHDVIEGEWFSRWKGGVDPTIPGDAKDKWKEGRGELRISGGRVYLLFDWDRGARKGLINARREGARGLVGKYLNVTDPKIMVPWIGLIISNERIDGRFPGGRLDFRR
jgi:hypothetical protein